MFYSVVLLDGKELQNLSLEQVKDLFFKRQINQNSLFCSSENPNWQMLKRGFDLSQWISSGAPSVSAGQNNFSPQNNPFGANHSNQSSPFQAPANQIQSPVSEPAPANQPVTFNQFPPNPPNRLDNPFAQNTSNGYSQNNQTETYYQAETNQTNYNFQNNQANFAPSKYGNPVNSYNYAANFSNIVEPRRGLRQAAVFLIANCLLNIVVMLIENLIASAPGPNDKMEGGIGRIVVSLVIDLILAAKLWKNEEAETARKWVLARSYLGFIVFGIGFPIAFIGKGEVFVGVFNFVAYFLFLISIMLVLHGKEGPSQSRVMVGMGTFALFFLFNFGVVALGSIVMLAPNLPKFDVQTAELEKYKIEGREFQDKTTGAKVVLPEGWSMIKLDNPVIYSPEARMIAVDKAGNRLTMLEVVPVPGNLDMKRQNSTFILDQLADGVVQALKEEVQGGGGFGGRNSINEVTRMSIFIGKHPAKLLVFDKTTDGLKAKGHLIITYDELTFYVLHSWCPSEEYDQAQNDFTFFEKNFTVPEKINSTFTQTAENDKKLK